MIIKMVEVGCVTNHHANRKFLWHEKKKKVMFFSFWFFLRKIIIIYIFLLRILIACFRPPPPPLNVGTKPVFRRAKAAKNRHGKLNGSPRDTHSFEKKIKSSQKFCLQA